MHTTVEIPLTRPNPRRLILGSDVEVSNSDLNDSVKVRGVISGMEIRKRHSYRANEDPYHVTLYLQVADSMIEETFDLDSILITYDPQDEIVVTEGPPPDSSIYLG